MGGPPIADGRAAVSFLIEPADIGKMPMMLLTLRDRLNRASDVEVGRADAA
jgi:hypothetical protein